PGGCQGRIRSQHRIGLWPGQGGRHAQAYCHLERIGAGHRSRTGFEAGRNRRGTRWDAGSVYLQEKAGKISIVGTTREYNLESILAQQPDLILAANGLNKEIYAKLSKLAPTVVAPYTGLDDWRKNVRIYAQALNRGNEAEQALT